MRRLGFFLGAITAATATLAAADAPRPNIVFILADDLGWGDVGYQGRPLAETLNLDRLASQGMRFTQGYAPAPICSATRAALLTGRSPARLHFEFVTKAPGAELPKGKVEPPPFPVDLRLEEVTVAEVLKAAGYATGFFGKWHLTQQNEYYLGHGETHGPRQQGFDVSSEERAVPRRAPAQASPRGSPFSAIMHISMLNGARFLTCVICLRI